MYEGEWERRSDNTIKTLGTDKKQLNTKVDEPYSNISAKDLVLFWIRKIRTSRVSRDFGTCVSVSVLCFDRFFRRLLFFSLQLIATNSLARGISLIKETDDYVGSLLTQGFVLSDRQENKTEERWFPHFLTEATHQNGAQHSQHANRSWIARDCGYFNWGSGFMSFARGLGQTMFARHIWTLSERIKSISSSFLVEVHVYIYSL